MSGLSPGLGLPYLQPSQAQKHVTHNAALQRLDQLVQLRLPVLRRAPQRRLGRAGRSAGRLGWLRLAVYPAAAGLAGLGSDRG